MEITPVFSWYTRYGAEIQKLFYSSITIKILLALHGNPVTKAALCAQTGHTPSAIQAKIRHLGEAGLVRGGGNALALTAAGTLLAPKLASMVAWFATQSGEAGGTPPEDEKVDPGPVLMALYQEHAEEIHMVLRSSVLTHLLLLLGEHPMTRDRLRTITGCSSPNFRAYIKKLLDAGLVREEGHKFSLTNGGAGISRGMEEFILTYGVVAEHRGFWEEHSLEGLPAFALRSIADLIGAELIGDDPMNSYQNFEHFLRVIAEAECMHGVSSWANPSIADAIAERVAEGVPVELVVSPELALHLFQQPYGEKVAALAEYPNLQFYVTDRPVSVGLTVTDTCISCGFFFNDGVTYDPLRDLYCRSPRSRAWGERLFQYYRRHAVPIEEVLASIPENRS